MKTRTTLLSLFLITGGLLSGCGGGSSGSDDDTATISGTVYASAVSGAQVTLKSANGEVVAGPVTTGNDGGYTLTVDKGRFGEPLIIESSGGTFTDEATGLEVNAGNLAAYLAAGELATNPSVSLTPGTTIIRELIVTYGKTPEEAKEIFKNAFGFTPDRSVAPRARNGEENQLRAALRAAAFSQLNMDLGLQAAEQFALLKAIATDLADGTADGSNAGSPVDVGSTGKRLPADIRNRFAHAYAGFFAGPNNETGLTADKLDPLPEGNVALTNSYRIERENMMGPMTGKSVCTLTITRNSDGAPATGLTLSLMPMMHMAMYSHSTPVDGCVEQADPAGTYRCTVYYLMASKMMNGMSMGYWDLKVSVDGEETHFYPSVMMAMGGDTPLAKLKGQNDLIATMSGSMMGEGGMEDHGMHMAAMTDGATEHRTYILFKDGIRGTTGNHTFDLFIAAKENMMSFPPVSLGTELTDENGQKWTVNSMSVEISTDQTNWIAATDNGDGHWSASGISGLTDGQPGTLYVKLTVNGEQKTDDGMAPDGQGDYAMFTVTPGASSMMTMGMEM